MKGLFKLLVFSAVIFFVSSIFKGGDGIRWIMVKTGVNLHGAADFADTFRLDDFMKQKRKDQREKEKGLLSY